jgi:hypothetical protein
MPLFFSFSSRLSQSGLFSVEKVAFITPFGRGRRAPDTPSALRLPGSRIAGSGACQPEKPEKQPAKIRFGANYKKQTIPVYRLHI